MEVPSFYHRTYISQLQDFQKQYDDEHWEHSDSDLSDIRHVNHHLGKMVGKLATYCEAMEHGVDFPTDQIVNEAIPDLFFWALHLSNRFGLRVEELYQRRMQANIKRFEAQADQLTE